MSCGSVPHCRELPARREMFTRRHNGQNPTVCASGKYDRVWNSGFGKKFCPTAVIRGLHSGSRLRALCEGCCKVFEWPLRRMRGRLTQVNRRAYRLAREFK